MAINKPYGFYYTIKIKMRPNSYVSNMLMENCKYRLFLYNKGVEFVKSKCCDNRYNVTKNEILKYLRNAYEKTSINRPYYLKDYDYYFRGISECVADDIYRSIRRVITARMKNNKSDLRFVQFNPNRMSFRIKNKLHKERGLTSYGHYGGNRLIIVNETDYYDTDDVVNTNPKIVKMKVNNKFGNVALKLCESTERFRRKGMLDVDSIEEIAIKFHNDIWYLCIIMENKEYQKKSIKKISKINRQDLAGIDVGEENPVVCYNGTKIVNIPDELLYPKDRVKKINYRINHLRSKLCKKYDKTLAELGVDQSNGYKKIQQKIHKCYVKLFNIIKDWQFKLSKWIVCKYKSVYRWWHF